MFFCCDWWSPFSCSDSKRVKLLQPPFKPVGGENLSLKRVTAAQDTCDDQGEACFRLMPSTGKFKEK